MKKHFYSIENRIDAGKFCFLNNYTVEIITEEILDYEKTRQIFEGAVYYAVEVSEKIYSVKFETQKDALNFVENLWCIFGTFAEIEHINFSEKVINGNGIVVCNDEYNDETLRVYRNNFCGYIVTKNGQNIVEYHNPNRHDDNGAECWDYLHNKFGYAE